MKAAADFPDGHSNDFYASTLAPVNQKRSCRFCAADMFILTILFVEMAAIMRLFLAK